MGKDLYLQKPKLMDKEIVKVMADPAVVSAVAYSHHEGYPCREPDPDYLYNKNLLLMTKLIDKNTGAPVTHHVSCLMRLWTLVADQETTC